MILRQLAFLGLLVALCAGCADSRTPAPREAASPVPASSPAGAEDRVTAEPDVCEAVFRYMFEHNASAAQKTAPTFYLDIRGKDPDKAFLARFKGNVPTVSVRSAFNVGKGVAFDIQDVRWISEKSLEVYGGYYEGNLSASGNTYFVERQEGKWVVVKDTMHWIS